MSEQEPTHAVPDREDASPAGTFRGSVPQAHNDASLSVRATETWFLAGDPFDDRDRLYGTFDFSVLDDNAGLTTPGPEPEPEP